MTARTVIGIWALTVLLGVLVRQLAYGQNSFPTPGGATVPGLVQMCYLAGTAKPCVGTVTSGSDKEFVTAGGAIVGGAVRMCIVANLAVPC